MYVCIVCELQYPCCEDACVFLGSPQPRSQHKSKGIDDVDTVIIEVSSVKELSLRGNPLRLDRAKHLQGPTVTQDFTLAKLGILT